MAFSFEKFVQRSTRGLFLFIVICMVVPLVLWGYMGKAGNEREEDKTPAGKIYGSITITKGEFTGHLQRAPASWWWKKYNDYMTLMMMRYGQFPPPPKAEELQKQAWEDIILLREAKAHGLEATEQETLLRLRDLYMRFTPRNMGFDYRDEIMAAVARERFHIDSLAVFKTWVAENATIEKLLDLVADSEFADYDKVYEQVAKGHQVAKVWTAAFDPKDSMRDLKPPTTDEIASQYSKNKDKYKIPGKVRVSYLMADTDEIKKSIPDPSEADIRKYYDEHKSEFRKPHEHHPGEDPHQHEEEEKQEPKSFEEVKAEIPGKMKQKEADQKAAETMSKVDVALGAIVTANSNKYPDDIFDQLYKKFKDSEKGLVHDITTSFDPKQIEDVEKIVGSNSTLGTWAFDAATKVGDVSQKIKTGKGMALFRLSTRQEAQDQGITDRVRESIVKELQKEQIRKRTTQQANNVVQEITTRGMSAARAKYPLDWRVTRYFKVGDHEIGLDDPSLVQSINQQLTGGRVGAGKATVLSSSNHEKADWAYVLYVEDLEDAPPEDVSSQFANQRKGVDQEARHKYRETFITQVVKDADVQVDPSLKMNENSSGNPSQP